jgi:hypothetical protein
MTTDLPVLLNTSSLWRKDNRREVVLKVKALKLSSKTLGAVFAL